MRQILCLFVLLSVASGVAHAKPSAKAAAHYDAGVAAYKAKDFARAIAEFEAGYGLSPEPMYLFNLGQACRMAQRPVQAVDYYKRYLDEVPDAENHAAVLQRVGEIERELAAGAKAAPEAKAALTSDVPPAAATRPAAANGGLTPYEVGVRVRGLFASNAMLKVFLNAATSMESISVAGEFVWHKERFDVVTSLDFSWLDVKDGNYLAKGNPADLDTHYTQFRGLSFLSADVSIIGHNRLQKWLEIRYGAGLGLGIVFGDVLLTNNFTGCTAQNAENIAACHPEGVDLTAPDREARLKATEAPGQRDTAQNPHRHVTDSKPPVMAVLNLLVGFRFYVADRWSITVDGGFRNAMFVGAGAHYRF